MHLEKTLSSSHFNPKPEDAVKELDDFRKKRLMLSRPLSYRNFAAEKGLLDDGN
jgi:hypothetical protein